MKNPTNEMFYRLIKKSKSKKESNTACILGNNQKHYDPGEQRKCFAEYYEVLAIPQDYDYDNIF